MNDLLMKRLDSLPDLNKIHLDFVNGSFKCLFSGDYISSKDYNNGKCDCCDGTDEIENHQIVCEFTCPIIIQKYKPEYYQFYLNSINNSVEILNRSLGLKKSIILHKKQSESEGLLLQQRYQNLTQNKKYYSMQIQKLVYERLNESDYQKYKINPLMDSYFKILSVISPAQAAKSKTDYKKKWKDIFKSNLTKSITNAINNESFEYVRDIGDMLSKHKHIKEELKNSTEDYIESRSVGARMMSLIESHLFQHDKWISYGVGNITFVSMNKTLGVHMENMHKITLNISGTVSVFDAVSRSGNIMEFTNKNNGKFILYNICNKDLTLNNFYRIHRNIYVGVMSSPIPCQLEPSMEDFIEYYRKLQFFE